MMIPVGDYKIHHSSEVQDLGRKDDVEKFMDTYKTGWPDPSHGDNEVIVDCVTTLLENQVIVVYWSFLLETLTRDLCWKIKC